MFHGVVIVLMADWRQEVNQQIIPNLNFFRVSTHGPTKSQLFFTQGHFSSASSSRPESHFRHAAGMLPFDSSSQA